MTQPRRLMCVFIMPKVSSMLRALFRRWDKVRCIVQRVLQRASDHLACSKCSPDLEAESVLLGNMFPYIYLLGTYVAM